MKESTGLELHAGRVVLCMPISEAYIRIYQICHLLCVFCSETLVSCHISELIVLFFGILMQLLM